MFDRYLIDMMKPEDCLCWRQSRYKDNDAQKFTAGQSKFTPAFGPEQKDEIGDIVYSCSDKEIPYHEHLDGCETFFFVEGEWEFIHMGQKFKVVPGDIVHVQPYQGHAFRPTSEFCRVVVMFQGKDMRYHLERRSYANDHFHELTQTPEWKQLQLEVSHDLYRSETYHYDIAPEGDSPAHRHFGDGIRTHIYPGLTLHLTIARYETHGIKEVWEAEMKKGLHLEFTTPRYDHRIFWVRSGSVRFNIDGEEFTAKQDMLVYVPPYHTFTCEAAENSNMVDMSCPYYLEELLEECHLLQAKAPEKLQDSVFMDELYHKYHAEPVKYFYQE